jgi:hypothetical protein
MTTTLGGRAGVSGRSPRVDGRSSRRDTAAALFAALALAGCASGGGGNGEGQPGAPLSATAPAEVTEPNVLTAAQLRQTDTSTLWDALRRLRPQWLQARADISLVDADGGGRAVVYLHGIRHGELSTLRQFNIDKVLRVEFIDGRDATTRFGTGHGGGVIMVDLNRE